MVDDLKVFNVGQNYSILPEGNWATRFWTRISGIRIVDIVDTNQNGKPDSGDTGITVNGERVDNIQLTGDSFNIPSESEIRTIRSMFLEEYPLININNELFAVRRVEPWSAEALAISTAGVLDEFVDARWEEAKGIGHSITDNPLLATGIAGAAVLASLHPYGRAALEFIGISGAMIGAGYMTGDSLSSIVNNKPLGEYHLNAFLAILGGAGALNGMTVSSFLKSPLNLLKFGGGGFGGSGLIPVYAGARNISFTVAAESVAEVEAAAGASKSLLDAIGPIVSITQIPEILSTPQGARRINEKYFSKLRKWEGSEAQKSSNKILQEMRAAAEEMKNKKPALEQEIAELKQEVKTIEERLAVLEQQKNQIKQRQNFIKSSTSPAKKLQDKEDLKVILNDIKHETSKMDQKKIVLQEQEQILKFYENIDAKLNSIEEKTQSLSAIYENAPPSGDAETPGIADDIVRRLKEISLEIDQDRENVLLYGRPPKDDFLDTIVTKVNDLLKDTFDAAGSESKSIKIDGSSEEVMTFFTSVATKTKTELQFSSNFSPHFNFESELLKDIDPKIAQQYLDESIELIKQITPSGHAPKTVRTSMKGYPDIGEVKFHNGGAYYRIYFSNKAGDGKCYFLSTSGKGDQNGKLEIAAKRLQEIKKQLSTN